MVSAPAAAQSTEAAWTVYVANAFSNTVTPIAVATDTAGTPMPAGDGPFGVAVTPDGATVYVTNVDSDTVTPIAVATNTAGAPIPVGDGPFAVAVTPDGATVYVANNFSGDVTPIAVATNTAGTCRSVPSRHAEGTVSRTSHVTPRPTGGSMPALMSPGLDGTVD